MKRFFLTVFVFYLSNFLVSDEKKIDFVVLKENIFLINNSNLDLTNEALKKFDEKTSNLKIQFVKKKGK